MAYSYHVYFSPGLHGNCAYSGTHYVIAASQPDCAKLVLFRIDKFQTSSMKFNQDPVSTVTVRKLERGEIKVGNDTIRENLVLHRDQVVASWNVSDIATITMEQLQPYLPDGTEIVLLGTGWSNPGHSNNRPSRELVFAMARQGVGFEFMDTPAACRTFNILVSEDRQVAAFLKITD